MFGLRHEEDRWTLASLFLLMPTVPLVQYANPAWIGWLLPLQLYCGFLGGVSAHNLNHTILFRNKRANSWVSGWASMLYGVPMFGWVPTHNQNHHRFLNGPGDDTITWRYWKENSARSMLAYFFISNRFQIPIVSEYFERSRTENPYMYRQAVLQRRFVIGSHLVMATAAIALHGLSRGLFVYFAAFVVQVAFGFWSMFYINFVQHVDCDPWSEFNHSRNFVGKLGNVFLFNAGYHTAHHEKPGLHWSKLAELHESMADRIDPRLNEPSLLWFTFRTYVLAPWFPSLNTKQVGRPAWDVAGDASAPEFTLQVAASGAGRNLTRVGTDASS